MAKNIEYKNLKPILKKKNPQVKDPVRFPNVINSFENQSKRDFASSLELELKQLHKTMLEFTK